VGRLAHLGPTRALQCVEESPASWIGTLAKALQALSRNMNSDARMTVFARGKESSMYREPGCENTVTSLWVLSLAVILTPILFSPGRVENQGTHFTPVFLSTRSKRSKSGLRVELPIRLRADYVIRIHLLNSGNQITELCHDEVSLVNTFLLSPLPLL
jgi:hypothetical protein